MPEVRVSLARTGKLTEKEVNEILENIEADIKPAEVLELIRIVAFLPSGLTLSDLLQLTDDEAIRDELSSVICPADLDFQEEE